MIKNTNLLWATISLSGFLVSDAFLTTPKAGIQSFRAPTPLFSATEEETKTEPKIPAAEAEKHDAVEVDPDAEGLPWWWELVWKLDVMQKGEQGEPIIFGDSANVLRTNIEQIYGGYPSLDGCPLAGKTETMHFYKMEVSPTQNPLFLFAYFI